MEPHLLPKTPDEARKIQIDIIYALHKAQAPTGLVVGQEPGLEEDVFHQPPLHPSLMALGYESNFSEAALLIGQLLWFTIKTIPLNLYNLIINCNNYCDANNRFYSSYVFF